MSNKRILPALILAGSVGFLGLHRFYAGRYYSGLVQLVLFVAGAAMLGREFAELGHLDNIDQVEEWLANHQVHPLPWMLVLIPTCWAMFDCILLLLRRFKDGSGNKMLRWV